MNRSSRSARRRRSPLSKPSSASPTAESRRNASRFCMARPSWLARTTVIRLSVRCVLRSARPASTSRETALVAVDGSMHSAIANSCMVHAPCWTRRSRVSICPTSSCGSVGARVPAHSAGRWTTAKSPPGDGNALRVLLTTARTDPAPRDESCSGGHVALRCATHHLIP